MHDMRKVPSIFGSDKNLIHYFVYFVFRQQQQGCHNVLARQKMTSNVRQSDVRESHTNHYGEQYLI